MALKCWLTKLPKRFQVKKKKLVRKEEGESEMLDFMPHIKNVHFHTIYQTEQHFDSNFLRSFLASRFRQKRRLVFFPELERGCGGSKWSWECETSSPNPKLFFFAVGYKTQNCRIFSIVISMAKVFYWVYPLPQKIWECRVVEKIKKKVPMPHPQKKKTARGENGEMLSFPMVFHPNFYSSQI